MTIYDAPQANPCIQTLIDYAHHLEAFRSGHEPYRALEVFERNILDCGLSIEDINMVQNTFRA